MYYPLRFLMLVVGTLVILWIASTLLIRVAPDLANTFFTGPAAAGAFIGVMMFPPYKIGQSFFRREGRQMRGVEGLLLALICATIFTVIIGGVVYYSLLQYPDSMAQVQSEIGEAPFSALFPMVLFALLVSVIYRLLFWLAIRGLAKRADQAAPDV